MLDWAARLADAADEAQVIGVCREYLLEMPGALLALPPGHDALRLDTSNDVAEDALRLVQVRCDGSPASNALETTAAFFATASARISQVLGRPAQRMFGHAHALSDD